MASYPFSKVMPKRRIRRVSSATTLLHGLQAPGRQAEPLKTLSRPSSTRLAAGSAGMITASQPKTINVVLCGDMGVGKRIINLISGHEVAKIWSDVYRCTLKSTRYDISFDDTDFCIFDTVGLGQSTIWGRDHIEALTKAHELVIKRSDAGRVHLLLFAMRGGRIATTTVSNYRLFTEVFCQASVPTALVFTGLEQEVWMEDWWTRNQKHIEVYGIKSDGHACVTTVQDGTSDANYKYMESQMRIRELLKDCCLKNEAFLPEADSWFARIGNGMRPFIGMHHKTHKRDIINVLTHHCELDPEMARELASIMARADVPGLSRRGDEGKSHDELLGTANLKARKEVMSRDSPAGTQKQSADVRSLDSVPGKSHDDPQTGSVRGKAGSQDLDLDIGMRYDEPLDAVIVATMPGGFTMDEDKSKEGTNGVQERVMIASKVKLEAEAEHRRADTPVKKHTNSEIGSESPDNHFQPTSRDSQALRLHDLAAQIRPQDTDTGMQEQSDPPPRMRPHDRPQKGAREMVRSQELNSHVGKSYGEPLEVGVVEMGKSGDLYVMGKEDETNLKHNNEVPGGATTVTDIVDKWKVIEAKPNTVNLKKHSNGETGTPINGIQSNLPCDLTGHVTKSSNYSFASGGFGDIYKGNLNMRGRLIDVAIKTTRVYLEHDQHIFKKMKQFRREVTVWSNLEHPNVLPLFGTISDPSMHPDIPAMVCPWIENGALTTYLERNDHLTVAKRLTLINDVAHGLQYLHSQHVVHGDLSGSTVLVDGDKRACIADFGLSTLLTRLDGSTFATTHQAKGTTRWMAPELFDTEDNYQTTPTTQSDVYSFGSIMLQILTGNIPYHYLRRNEQVILTVGRGTRPKRPDGEVVTDHRWKFIQWCWSPAISGKSRPSTEKIVGFTRKELAQLHQRI